MKAKLSSIAGILARASAIPIKRLAQAIETQRQFEQQVRNIAALTGNTTQAKSIAHGKKLQELEQIAFWLAEGHSLEDAVRYVTSD